MKFWLLAVILPGIYAFTDSMWVSDSILEREKEEDLEQFGEVMIKSISADGERVIVSVIPADSEDKNLHRQTLELCPAMVHVNTSGEAENTPKRLLQEAFNEGKRVRVQYDGTIERCISQVQLSSQSI